MLVAAARGGDLDLLEKALQTEASQISVADKLKRTPLHLAAFSGHAAVCERLIAAKADVHVKAQDGFTALHFASQKGHFECAKIILQHAHTGHAHSREVFLNQEIDKKKQTALFMAVQRGHVELAQLLASRGANADIKASSGQTARSLASEKGIDLRSEVLPQKRQNTHQPAKLDAQKREESAAAALAKKRAAEDAQAAKRAAKWAKKEEEWGLDVKPQAASEDHGSRATRTASTADAAARHAVQVLSGLTPDVGKVAHPAEALMPAKPPPAQRPTVGVSAASVATASNGAKLTEQEVMALIAGRDEGQAEEPAELDSAAPAFLSFDNFNT